MENVFKPHLDWQEHILTVNNKLVNCYMIKIFMGVGLVDGVGGG